MPMALLGRLTVVCVRLSRVGQQRGCSTLARHPWLSRGGLIRSGSDDVFANLALEDWIYRQYHVLGTVPPALLMLWRNRPCVVIGRHQNPWSEVRLSALRGDDDESTVALARRNSGGGTVYHDLGNLNCTFFSSRTNYNRRGNLELICEAIRRSCPDQMLDVSVSSREDILLDQIYKISGTAAKLGRDVAYHHCTVLSNVDTSLLSRVLTRKVVEGFQSRGTRSIRSPVKNLRDAISSLNCDALVDILGKHFLEHHNLANYQVTDIVPTERFFPGLSALEDTFKSWNWIYGKCPQFTIERRASLPFEWLVPSVGVVTLRVKVCQGTIQELHLSPDHWLAPNTLTQLNALFIGAQFPHNHCQIHGFHGTNNGLVPATAGCESSLQVTFLSEIVFNCMKDLL